MKYILLIGIFGLVCETAFAADPNFYPNEKYKTATQAVLQADVSKCKGEAMQSGQGAQRGDGLRQGVRGAAKGAATGAVVGAITEQNVGRATGAGAAVGGARSAAKTVKESGENNPEFQKYVTACLEEIGYKVVGWKK